MTDYRHVTASGLPGCLPNDNPIESFHAMLVRMKMLTYRSSMLTFLHTTWPNIMFLTCLDLCSPPKRHLDLMSASSLRSGLALLEAFGPDGQPVYSVYSHVDHEDQPDEEGAYSVFVLNATTAHDKPLEKNRVCMASMVGVGSLAPLTHTHTHTHTTPQPPNIAGEEVSCVFEGGHCQDWIEKECGS